jgi:hemolysin III
MRTPPTEQHSTGSRVSPHQPTYAEELVHSLTHGVGALLAMISLVTLVLVTAVHGGDATALAAVSVFGASLVLVYVSSTVYHAIPPSRTRAKDLFQILDHAAIHLLIAGTYTPLLLNAVGGAWGWASFAVVWTIATLGVVVETTSLRHHARLSIALYLAAGWLAVLALPLFWTALSPAALVCLALGGVAYTAGVPFFLAHTRRWMHAWWHGFVLAGSAFHVAAIALVAIG